MADANVLIIPIILGLVAIGIAMTIVYLFPASCAASQYEGFANYSLATITTCPRFTRSFVDERGNTMCCDGEVERGKCKARTVCTMSENATDEIPTCTEYKRRYLEEQSRQCPSQLPLYYESDTGAVRGCAARVNQTAMAPQGEFCRLYGDKSVDEVQDDSCYSYSQRRLGKSIKSELRNDFCLGLPFQTTQNGVRVQMNSCTKQPTMSFRQDTKRRFVNLMSGKCLDVAGAGRANGTPVLQWDCHDGNHQKWVLDTQKRLRPLHAPHMCLDILTGSTQNGAQLGIWQCHNWNNQKWTIA